MSAQTTSSDLAGIYLTCGNPILDVSAEVPAEFLTKYDVKLDNAILAEEAHMGIFEELASGKFKVQHIPGGAGQNTTRVCQWILGVPGACGYMGGVGSDANAETMTKMCSQEGVDVHYHKDPDTPTGQCAVLVVDGERSLIAHLAAANTFKFSHVETDKAKSMIERAQYYYIAGFFLTVCVPAIEVIGKEAVAKSKVFAMNLSAPFLVDFFGDQMATALPYVDIVFGNESEAAAYGKKHGYGEDIETIALKLAAQPKASGTRCRTVVFTQGSESTIVAANGQVTKYPVDVLPKSLLVDTNGAGDAFCGGFMAQLIKGAPIEECVRCGHWASRVIIQRSGCTFPATCDFV